MNNILIVESENDKYFIQALIKHLELQNVEFGQPICEINNYQCLNGLDETKLINILNLLRKRRLINKNEKIGIIIDLDNETKENRLQLINNVIQSVFATENSMSQTNEFISITIDKDIQIQIGCYFMNVNGKGELETVLKAIKKRPSFYADCLEQWRACLPKENQITDKEFDKFWVNIYHRYDCCSKEEKQQAGKKCDNEASFSKDIYDFDSDLLQKLREFLITLSQPIN